MGHYHPFFFIPAFFRVKLKVREAKWLPWSRAARGNQVLPSFHESHVTMSQVETLESAAHGQVCSLMQLLLA